MMLLYRVAERVRQNEYQNALALGYGTLDAINMSWAAYNDVMLQRQESVS